MAHDSALERVTIITAIKIVATTFGFAYSVNRIFANLPHSNLALTNL